MWDAGEQRKFWLNRVEPLRNPSRFASSSALACRCGCRCACCRCPSSLCVPCSPRLCRPLSSAACTLPRSASACAPAPRLASAGSISLARRARPRASRSPAHPSPAEQHSAQMDPEQTGGDRSRNRQTRSELAAAFRRRRWMHRHAARQHHSADRTATGMRNSGDTRGSAESASEPGYCAATARAFGDSTARKVDEEGAACDACSCEQWQAMSSAHRCACVWLPRTDDPSLSLLAPCLPHLRPPPAPPLLMWMPPMSTSSSRICRRSRPQRQDS